MTIIYRLGSCHIILYTNVYSILAYVERYVHCILVTVAFNVGLIGMQAWLKHTK
jgi:hypothetical protein